MRPELLSFNFNVTHNRVLVIFLIKIVTLLQMATGAVVHKLVLRAKQADEIIAQLKAQIEIVKKAAGLYLYSVFKLKL